MRNHLDLPELNDRQIEIVTGAMLGDASITSTNYCRKTINWHFSTRQSKYDKNRIDKINYISFLFNEIGLHSSSIGGRTTKNKFNFTLKKPEYYSYHLITHCHPIWTKLGKKWYATDENGNVILNKINRIIKIVPNDLKLTPLTACIWFMDDGFNYPKDGNCSIATHGFSIEECLFLIERLNIDLNVKSTLRLESRFKQPFIFIGIKSWKDFIEIIKPYVQWDCFQYKISTEEYKKIHQSGECHWKATLTDTDIKTIFQLYNEGWQQKQIANKFHVGTAHMAQILNGKLWTHLNMPLKPPSNHMRPHLTEEQKKDVFSLREQGLTHLEIATRIGVNQSTITRTFKKIIDRV